MSQSTSKQNTSKELIEQARSVLGGQSIGIEALKTLAKELNNLSEFSYARKLYNRVLAGYKSDERGTIILCAKARSKHI